MRNACSSPDCDRPAYGRGLCSPHYQKARYHGELPEISISVCHQCGKTYSNERKWNSHFCSDKCKERSRGSRSGPRVRETCAQCDRSLEDKRIDARFCDEKCGDAWRNAKKSAKLREHKVANPRSCKGCGNAISPERKGHALYCSDECKIRSRRHQAYGLTADELTALLAQHEKCAICQTDDWGKRGPQVDHCHATGKVRGILCINCNNGLGRFADDPIRLRAAATYLE